MARTGASGYVVFVAGALPGDRVRAQVYKSKRAYAHARTLELLRPSAERIPPRADHPGVPWQVLPYERQLEVKAEQVDRGPAAHRRARALRARGDRAGEASSGAIATSSSSPSATMRTGALVCGFHAPARWNRVESMEDCLLASERVNRARRIALAWAHQEGLRAWERAVRPHRRQAEGEDAPARARPSAEERTGPGPDGRALLRNLVVREGRRTGTVQVRLVSTDGELDVAALADALREGLGEESLGGVLWSRSRQLGETTAGGETELVWGRAELAERICELDVRIPPEAFFQTNTEMAEVLYGIAADYAALEGWERVYDLYCGLGTIALSLARHAGEVWGAEISEQAVEGARAGAERNGVSNARFRAGEARHLVRDLLESVGRPDVVDAGPAARRRGPEGDRARARGLAAAARLRLLQPDHARRRRGAARAGRSGAAPGAARGHVPADAPHRVRRVAREKLGSRRVCAR